MKEKIITLVACLFLATTILSAKSLVLTLKNGSLVYYLLGEESNPMMRFVDGGIAVNTDKYEFANIRNFYISATDDPSGIKQVMKGDVQYTHNMVVVDTENSLLPTAVYTCDGHKIDTPIQQANGKTLVDLNPLPQGSYVVTIGESSLKILKK